MSDDYDRLQALLDAADRGDLPAVIGLLDAGVPVDAVTNGRFPWTSLMHAAYRGRLDVVRLLLDRGANVAHQDLDYFTAAAVAAGEGHWDVLEVLARRGADLDFADGTGTSPLSYAEKAGPPDLVIRLKALRAAKPPGAAPPA